MEKILLGTGIFKINGTAIGLTDGGSFVVDREFKHIEADGDMGIVKDRSVLVSEIPKLQFAKMTFITSGIPQLFPAFTYTTDATNGIITPTGVISSTDYVTLASWEGNTIEGRKITIEVDNAINFDGINLGLVKNEEVKTDVTYTGTYLDAARRTPPYRIKEGLIAYQAAPIATLLSPTAGTNTRIVMVFDRPLALETLAITNINDLLNTLTHNGVAVSCAAVANSVIWVGYPLSQAIITIPSTVFTSSSTVVATIKTGAVCDLDGSPIWQTTLISATVI